MPQFTVDESLAALVEKLAKPKPFENLSFNSALNRVLKDYVAILEKVKVLEKGVAGAKEDDELDQLLAESMALKNKIAAPKKVPSPNPISWVIAVPELKSKRKLTTWKAICQELKIPLGGDSGRRRLQNWVKTNRPDWPPVPDTD